MSKYLTPEELYDLTNCKQKKGQIRWLRKRHWIHEMAADGSPRVLRSYHDERMSGTLVLQKSVTGPQKSTKIELVLDRGQRACTPGGR